MSEMFPPASASVTSSRWEDFIDVFIAPTQLFRRRSDGKFGHALVVLIVVIGVVFFLTRNAMQPIMDAEFQRSMAANPRVTPEQMETARKFAASFAPVFVIISIPIVVFVLGAVIWLVARIVGGRTNYAQSATIATFAYFPRALESIVNGVQALLMDEAKLTSRFSVSLGLGRLLDPTKTSGALMAVLGRVDLFTIWITMLVAVGLKQMTRITTAQAIGGATLVWLIGALPTLFQALRAG
jgi:Yip1-like protein